MLFPDSRMEIAQSYQGKQPKNGWLVLRVTGMDLEGVDRIYIDLDQVEALREKRAQAKRALEDFWAMPEEEGEQ